MAYADKNIDTAAIYTEPPGVSALTDEDSGDDDVNGDLDRLTGRQLRAPVGIQQRNNLRINSGTLQDILIKLSNIENDITALKKTHSDIIQSVQFYGDKIDVFATKIQEFEKTIISVKHAKQQIDNNILNITNLADEIEKIQPYSRMNNLEISGMPEEKNENLISITDAPLEKNQLIVATGWPFSIEITKSHVT
ncbi:hypothetical protein JTB14_004184 [Gonioctena quinquepunctata]|nr:hypothetical protein JTB14_004184 [Gonioctena quinquepunctata]